MGCGQFVPRHYDVCACCLKFPVMQSLHEQRKLALDIDHGKENDNDKVRKPNDSCLLCDFMHNSYTFTADSMACTFIVLFSDITLAAEQVRSM